MTEIASMVFTCLTHRSRRRFTYVFDAYARRYQCGRAHLAKRRYVGCAFSEIR
jgi:hypothetical protein